ncbi:hypothetical protein AKJ16_DCAP06645 [Drosera capensis]
MKKVSKKDIRIEAREFDFDSVLDASSGQIYHDPVRVSSRSKCDHQLTSAPICRSSS